MSSEELRTRGTSLHKPAEAKHSRIVADKFPLGTNTLAVGVIGGVVFMLRFISIPWRWVLQRIDYAHFKIRQFKDKRKAKKDDPNIYPLW